MILFLADPPDGVSSSYSWIDNTSEVWKELRGLLQIYDPSSIAVNADYDVSFSSGMHAGELAKVKKELGKDLSRRMVVEPMVAVEVIATMVDGKLPWYRKLQETAWAMITEGFSESVIEPGVTTTEVSFMSKCCCNLLTVMEDVEWWHREKMQQLNYTTWFQPTVSILGKSLFEGMVKNDDPHFGDNDKVIQYGDLLHVDFGVTAMGMNTDTQHMAYVLSPGETADDIPQGYLDGLKKANRLQDIVKSNMKIGSTGNDILKISLKQMRSEGIEGRIYCHPIGDWGHSAGTLLGRIIPRSCQQLIC